MKLEIGDIIFVSGNGFIGESIKEITHSTICHVAIVVEPENGILIEANNAPIDWTNSQKYKGCQVGRVVDLSDDQKGKIKDYAIKALNKDYDYHDILEELERYLFHKKLKKEDGKAFICSSLVNNCYLSAGISLTDENLPSPADLYKSNQIKKIGVL